VEDGSQIELFDSKSFAYRFSVPVFVSQKEDPWGLRAGIAPEYNGRITDSHV
jgi:hypothetical protein